jgi:tetratricopeptide (TPR) repeat protein
VSSAASPFGPVERARAIAEFGNLDATAGLLEEARGRLTAAKALYHDAGHVAGELETLADLTHLLVERGHFHEAAKEFDRLLPHVELISNPKKRLSVMDDAARAQSFSGRTDEAVESLLKVVAQAREFELRAHEGGASQELGYLYHGRGDYIQAKAFFNRALQITREDQDAHGLGYTLQSAGMMARLEGDYATAIAMHEEAVRLVKHPVGHMRAVRQLALDHLAQGNCAARWRRTCRTRVTTRMPTCGASWRRRCSSTATARAPRSRKSQRCSVSA